MTSSADHGEKATLAQEVVNVVRSSNCRGVELIEAQHSPRCWGHFNSVFSFVSMSSWHGQVDYRRRNLSLANGDVFLVDPGELFHAQPSEGRPGSFRVIEISPETFEALCRAEGNQAPVHFARAFARANPQLGASLAALHAALLRNAEALEQQSRLAAVAHAALTTVLESAPRSFNRPVPLGPCERLREILHSSEGSHLNLGDFAQAAGVSQFQLLRAFKRRYGAPPHAYGLHVRIDRARQMLRSGFSVTEAAAANDFTDQSHFTRHFRRIWKVPPGCYAAGAQPFAAESRSSRTDLLSDNRSTA